MRMPLKVGCSDCVQMIIEYEQLETCQHQTTRRFGAKGDQGFGSFSLYKQVRVGGFVSVTFELPLRSMVELVFVKQKRVLKLCKSE